LFCETDEIIRYSGTEWVCSEEVITNAETICGSNEVLTGDGTCISLSNYRLEASSSCEEVGLAGRYFDCGNGTVTDSETGLIWLKRVGCLTAEYGIPRNFVDANNIAEALQEGGCDLTDNSEPGDWRLPTRAEWEATFMQPVGFGCINPALSNQAGTGCISSDVVSVFTELPGEFPLISDWSFWSSTSELDTSGTAVEPFFGWVADLRDGNVFQSSLGLEGWVWPVRR